MLRVDRRAWRAALLNESGGTLVETALTTLVLMFMLLGVMQGALSIYTEHSIAMLARDAARYAMVRGADFAGSACLLTTTVACNASATDVTNFVQAMAPPGIAVSQLTVSTEWPGTDAVGGACDQAQGANSAGCIVRVTVRYPYAFALPMPNQVNILFGAHATMTITQ